MLRPGVQQDSYNLEIYCTYIILTLLDAVYHDNFLFVDHMTHHLRMELLNSQ